MRRLTTIILPLFLGSLFSTALQTGPEAKAQITYELPAPVDLSDRYAILQYDTIYYRLFPRRGRTATAFQPTTLSQEEIDSCYRLMAVRIEDHNKAEGAYRSIDLDGYCFQFIPALSWKGEKIVFVNGLCRGMADQTARTVPDLNWREVLLQADDGGKCFFDLTIDLHCATVMRFSVNGP